MEKSKVLIRCILLCGLFFGAISAKPGIDVPQTEITNGLIKATIYLPDAQKGYYRGVRFDWSGVIASLEHDGHTYFGQWFDSYNPTNHDAVMGPAEDFGAIGYAEAKEGESFVKIGVGSLIKPKEPQYSFSKLYTVSNPGTWKIKKKANEVEFTHTLTGPDYAYVYEKKVVLTKGRSQMVIEHMLKNNGKKSIKTTVYNHNFFVIDRQRTGPGYVVSFPFKNLSAEGGRGVGETVTLKDNQILFLRDLAKGEHTYFPNLIGGNSMPYEMRVENIKTGAGVRISGDRPLSRLSFWSSPTAVSPEPYIYISVEPGKEFSWKISYEFYSIPGI